MSDNDDDGAGNGDGQRSFAPGAWHGRTVDDLLSTPRGMPVQNSEELDRILKLPRRPTVEQGSANAEAIIELEMQRYSRGPRKCRCAEISEDVRRGARTCILRLAWAQAWALRESRMYGGLLANIPVGAGKSLLNIVVPIAIPDVKCVLVLVPTNLVGQLKTDYLLIAEHFRVPRITLHLPGKKTWPATQHPEADPRVMLHVLPYSRLSGTQNSEWIKNLRPDAIISDEVDSLKDITSSRTMRVLRYYSEFAATTKFFGWTGSMTDNSVKEFAHTLYLALRRGSPLPVQKDVIDDWSRCLDAVPCPCPPGALVRLLDVGEPASNLRRAFRRRLSETAGCILVEGRQIITTPEGREIALDVREQQAPDVPQKVLDALEQVRNFVRPDKLGGALEDEIIGDPLEQAKCVREVATGMFYKWKFPKVKGADQDRGLIAAWYGARKEWNSELRRKCMGGEAQLDSAKLCENAARRAWRDDPPNATLPEWRAGSWPAWRDIKDRVVHETEAVRIDSFLVEDAIGWSESNRGLIWYGMVEFAMWMHELSGLPVYGQGSGEDIVDKEDGSRCVLASIKSHARGRNGLQFKFDNQLIINTLASARMWQQLLGRLHRRGQKSDVVRANAYLHTPELRATFNQARRRGEYVENVTGEDQKLLMGYDEDEDYDIE